MKLSAGERYPLTDEKMYIVLTSGEAEVYAVTKQQDSFRQMFLTELSPGGGGVSLDGRVRHGRRGGLRCRRRGA
ncbi:MAG: hypothetical protein J5963_09305 [Schwartzia sp.]|nr:hypothetical protein [Schwartzia sp. (in: firmicutes)]